MSNPSNFVNLAVMMGIPEAALEEILYQLAAELRVAIPVVVVSFNATKQTVVVQPAIQENALQNGVPTPQAISALEDVVICPPRGGGFTLTLPLQAGDEGFVVFQDMCYDNWYQSGGVSNNQATRRRHSLSDAMFIPGGWSQPRVLSGYSTTKAQLRSDDGTTLVEVGSGEVTITPDSGTTKLVATAGTITVTGNLVVNGNLSATGTLDGKTFLTHTHSGVTTGGGNTGPPV
jgi:hypothetical protein